MRKHFFLFVLPAICMSLLLGASAGSAQAAERREPAVRELYVPFEQLNILLENQPRRVLLSRQEYEELLTQAKSRPPTTVPVPAAILSADYQATVEQERARINGQATLEVLEDGLHTVRLDLAGVGLRRIMLDEKDAAVGRGDQGQVELFVKGKGIHQLKMDLVTPLNSTAAQQILDFRIPVVAATRFRMTVPGDVEVKSGMKVVERVYDSATSQTHFELLPAHEKSTIVMSLNSHLLRQDRVVVSRAVLVDEATQNDERLYATFSLSVLHRAVDSFQVAVPAGFEIVHVNTPLLARWSVIADEPNHRQILKVHLREQTTQTVVLNVMAIRPNPPDNRWTFPSIKALEVIGEMAVIGLLLENRLQAQTIRSEALIPIDTSLLSQALPASVFQSEPGAPRVRPIVAYYAPQSTYQFAADFVKPPPRLRVSTNLLLTVTEKNQRIRGGFSLLPEIEQLFAVSFSLPQGWQVTDVTAGDGNVLPFEQLAGRIHVRMPKGVPIGRIWQVRFQARHVPSGWLDNWIATNVQFPVFRVLEATTETGAIAVAVEDDLEVRPDVLKQLTPLDNREKETYGLMGVPGSLAYRFDAIPYDGTFTVERIKPRLTAQTYSFLTVMPDVLIAHYEVAYDVEQAKVHRLRLSLPDSTPETVSILGIDGVVFKEYASELVDHQRRWTILLAEARQDSVRLAIDFQLPLPTQATRPMTLPVVHAEDVAHQAGFVAVEGSAELDLQVTTKLRKVDIGELVAAKYQPGKRLLGIYGFVGDLPEVQVSSFRHAAHDLPPVLVERAGLVTILAAQGTCQNAARITLRSKSPYLEIMLPPAAALWSAELDGMPAKPQRGNNRLLLDLPVGNEKNLHDLRFIYEMPIDQVSLHNTVNLLAPTLMVRASNQSPGQAVPIAMLSWQVYVPPGYHTTAVAGTVQIQQLPGPSLAVYWLGQQLYEMGGGINLLYHSLARARELSSRSQVEEQRAGSPPPAAPYGGVSFAEKGDKKIEQFSEDRFFGTSIDFSKPQEAVEHLAVEPQKSVPPPSPPPVALVPQSATTWAMEGVRSLKIDLQSNGTPLVFTNLGSDSQLSITLVDEHRTRALGWAIACAIFLWGVYLVCRPARQWAGYVTAILLVATLIPLVSGSLWLTEILNPSFMAAVMLLPLYLLAGVVRGFLHRLQRSPLPIPAAIAVGLFLCLVSARGLTAAENALPQKATQQTTKSTPPLHVPADAIILPYDTAGKSIHDAQQMLVPYDRYVELWNRAHPDQQMNSTAMPALYGWAGVVLNGQLKGNDDLRMEAQADIEVYADQTVHVPLPLENCVLIRAELDGLPAQLGVAFAGAVNTTQPAAPEAKTDSKGTPLPAGTLVLSVTGQGRHHLTLAAQFALHRSGGWHVAEGRLIAAPVCLFRLSVPQPQTEVQLAGVSDRVNYLTTMPDQVVQTALKPDGTISLQWRPKVTEGVVDQSLTVQSTALLDVQEDGTRALWRLTLDFRRSERNSFRLFLPLDYLVTRVAGANVRGWESKRAANAQQLDIFLLQPAKDQDRFDVHFWRPRADDLKKPAIDDVPTVTVDGAALANGSVVIRRSPLLNVRIESTKGVSRIDLPAPTGSPDDLALSVTSPLGIRPLAAYKFASVPFSIRLAITSASSRVHATVQTILRFGEQERNVESRIILDVQDRSIYHVNMLVPADLELERVMAPSTFEWTLTAQQDRKLLTIIMATGQLSSVPIVISGRWGQAGSIEQISLPRLEVLDVQEQEGQIVVQSDPAYRVQADNLQNCESILLHNVAGWLTPQQGELVRLALRCHSGNYSGDLRLVPRTPSVQCYTVSNIRITDRAFEETVLLNFTINQAGIREAVFLLPQSMKDARIHVPQLRQKTVEAVSADEGGFVRFRLQLQDKMMGQLRVLVENDRMLTAGVQEAPIPVVETGRTDQRYVLLENSGRDEIVVETQSGMVTLDRRQKEWQILTDILGKQITSAYLVEGDAHKPVLAFKSKDRSLVETVGARIGLAQTWISMDASGTYRAIQNYQIDNSIEQFLEIRLPDGAKLWTAQVAGAPVKPTASPDVSKPDHLLIPLVKTAAGELDYKVVLKYGGQLPKPGGMRATNVPLIQPVNINAELCQVRLYLPEECHWFDFGGTMTRIEEEADLAAGVVAYKSKQAERLDQVMRGFGGGFGGYGGFAKVRAAANVRQLQSDVKDLQMQARSIYTNERLQKEMASNLAAISGAAQQSTEVEKQLAAQQGEDNRLNLYNYFAGQQVARSSNVVNRSMSNFGYSAIQTEAPEGGRVFDTQWLFSNGLGNTATEQIANAHVRFELGDHFQMGRIPTQIDKATPLIPSTMPSSMQAPAVAYTIDELSKIAPEQKISGREKGIKDRIGQYQQSLQSQAGQSMRERKVQVVDQLYGETAGTRESESVEEGVRGVSSGLTSLDVDIPKVGRLYRFTSPRGQATITARGVSRLFTGTLERLGLAVLIVLGTCLAAKMTAVLAIHAARSRMAVILIITGLFSMLIGLLPVLGLVLFLVGVVVWVSLRASRSSRCTSLE